MVNFLKFVASVVRFPDSMGYKFPRLWLNNKNEPINKIREILKLLVTEQDQDRWYKHAP